MTHARKEKTNIKDTVERVPTTLPAVIETGVQVVPQDKGKHEDQLRRMATEISAMYAETKGRMDSALRRVIACGLALNYTKEWGRETKTIPHGEFGEWLKTNCPDVPWRTVQQWMQLAKGVVAMCQIGSVADLPQALLAEDTSVAPEIASQRQSILDLITGQSQRTLLLQFRDLDAPRGGDVEWAAWLRKTHPELIQDGAVPKRRQVSEEVQAEWEAHWAAIEKERLTPAVRRQIAQKDCEFLLEAIFKRGVRNANLRLLPPSELLALHTAVSQFKDKLDKLRNPKKAKR